MSTVHPKEITAPTSIVQLWPLPPGLPKDLIVELFKYFTSQDIQSCRLVSGNWNTTILAESAIWINLFKRIYPRMDPKEVKDLQTYQTAALRVRLNISEGVCTSGLLDSKDDFPKESRKMFIVPGSFIARGNFYDEKGLCYLKMGNTCLQLKSFDLNQKNTMIVINNCAGLVSFDESKDLLFASYLGSMGILNVKEGTFRDLSPPDKMQQVGICSHVIFYENRLITSHFSGKILIWDSDSGAYITHIKGHDEAQIKGIEILNNQLHVAYLHHYKIFEEIYELKPYFRIHYFFSKDRSALEGSVSNQIEVYNQVFSISVTGFHIIAKNSKDDKILFYLEGEGEGEMNSLAFCNHTLFATDSLGNILFWNFASKNSDVFDEIATEFESGSSDKINPNWRHQKVVTPLVRFLRMSQAERIKVYEEFYKLIKDRLINDYEGCAEQIFNGLDKDQTCAQAIRNSQEAEKKNENSQ